MSGREFSFARHAVLSLGAATAGLALAVLVLNVARPGPVGSLVIVGAGLILTVVLLAVVARANMRRYDNTSTRDRSEGGPHD